MLAPIKTSILQKTYAFRKKIRWTSFTQNITAKHTVIEDYLQDLDSH